VPEQITSTPTSSTKWQTRPEQRFGSPGKQVPSAETKASPVRCLMVTSSGGEEPVESWPAHRGPEDESGHSMARVTLAQHHSTTSLGGNCDRTPAQSASTRQPPEIRRGAVYQCHEVDTDVARIRTEMASAEAAPVCRCLVGLAGRKLATCLDTVTTFSLLSVFVYQELWSHLPPLDSSDLVLTGAGGESL
jgi:hypothetical protein